MSQSQYQSGAAAVIEARDGSGGAELDLSGANGVRFVSRIRYRIISKKAAGIGPSAQTFSIARTIGCHARHVLRTLGLQSIVPGFHCVCKAKSRSLPFCNVIPMIVQHYPVLAPRRITRQWSAGSDTPDHEQTAAALDGTGSVPLSASKNAEVPSQRAARGRIEWRRTGRGRGRRDAKDLENQIRNEGAAPSRDAGTKASSLGQRGSLRKLRSNGRRWCMHLRSSAGARHWWTFPYPTLDGGVTLDTLYVFSRPRTIRQEHTVTVLQLPAVDVRKLEEKKLKNQIRTMRVQRRRMTPLDLPPPRRWRWGRDTVVSFHVSSQHASPTFVFQLTRSGKTRVFSPGGVTVPADTAFSSLRSGAQRPKVVCIAYVSSTLIDECLFFSFIRSSVGSRRRSTFPCPALGGSRSLEGDSWILKLPGRRWRTFPRARRWRQPTPTTEPIVRAHLLFAMGAAQASTTICGCGDDDSGEKEIERRADDDGAAVAAARRMTGWTFPQLARPVSIHFSASSRASEIPSLSPGKTRIESFVSRWRCYSIRGHAHDFAGLGAGRRGCRGREVSEGVDEKEGNQTDDNRAYVSIPLVSLRLIDGSLLFLQQRQQRLATLVAFHWPRWRRRRSRYSPDVYERTPASQLAKTTFLFLSSLTRGRDTRVGRYVLRCIGVDTTQVGEGQPRAGRERRSGNDRAMGGYRAVSGT
ncbi:hypothetical protein R3P38DRAFT_3215449 [Favolaschia claudopus]|uniref:Uncharacterized protein n=1 Tax=Favolaschia claudopus TaxID=2862362 RepID=A0AAW0A7L9_9AGAR